MKKILATLLACGLALQTCAFAKVEISSVEYDRATNKISATATAGIKESASVIITVGKKGETLSATNLPEFMYLYKTGDKGAVNEKLALHSSIVSGKYTVYMTMSDGKDQKDIMVLNLKDTSDGGTVSVLAELNGATDSTGISAIIGNSSKMEKLGVDPDLMSARNAYVSYASEILIGKKSSAWTVDTFVADYNKALALSSAKSGQNIDAVMKKYAGEFGTTYEAYTELSDNEKNYIQSYFKGIDYVTADLTVAYANMFELMKYKSADAWGELRDVINAEREAGNAAFDFTAYDKIDKDRQETVFTRLLTSVASSTSEAEIAEAFWNITYAVYEEQLNSSSTATSAPVPTHTTSNVPARNDGDVIHGGNTNGGYDNKTDKATPAPTETPVQTEAPVPTETPALEAGEFADTVNHWAKDYVKTLANAGVVGGYDDGTFLPDKNVTRAEYIKMIVGMFGLEESQENIFADVADDAWYKEYVEKALAAGLIEGDGGNFNPDATITRQDAAVILYRLGIAGGDNKIEFSDATSIADYAKEAVEVLASAGVINGSDGKFNPTNAITRAETAAILCRAAEVGMSTGDEPKEDVTEEPAEEPKEDVTEEPTEEPTEDVTEEPAEEPTEDTTETVVDEETTEDTTGEETVTE